MIKSAILLLCGVGFYASAFMYRKSVRAGRGKLVEPSVVESPRARVFAGVPNAAFGLLYYIALAASVPFLAYRAVWTTALAASLAAALFSVYLAYSLLFVTRMPCFYCWTSHAANVALVVLLLLASPRP
jgi:uncharacterized membrane protein